MSKITAPVAEATGLEQAALSELASQIFQGVQAALEEGVPVQIAGFGKVGIPFAQVRSLVTLGDGKWETPGPRD